MNKKLKTTMILSSTYIVLMAVLLIGVSTAKYTQSTVAYSSFGTAGFNVVVLNQTEDGAGELTDGSVTQFGKTLLASDYTPGMKYTGSSETNTAKVLPFTVANGTSAQDVSEVATEYTITVRTTKNLPLSYKLLLGNTVYNCAEAVAIDKNGNAVKSGFPELDDKGIAWYEWTFKDIVNTAEGTVEANVSPTFTLLGGKVNSNSHALVIEWPIDTDSKGNTTDNSTDYMKEIELLEVRINAAAKKNTTELPTDPEEYTNRDYSKGFIVYNGEDEVLYKVDYRAFKPTAEGLEYCFTVDNGVGIGSGADEDYRYEVEMTVPLLWQENDNCYGSASYSYLLEMQGTLADGRVLDGDLLAVNTETVYKIDVNNSEKNPIIRDAAGNIVSGYGAKFDVTDDLEKDPDTFNNNLSKYSRETDLYRMVTHRTYSLPGTSVPAVHLLKTLDTSKQGDEGDAEIRPAANAYRILIKDVPNNRVSEYIQMLGKIEIRIKKAE